jgi:sec-independent protein translocase protein TatA
MLSSVFLFLNIGTGEMILILFAALMLFGGNKLPELARGLGKGIRDFKDASEDVKREINNQINNYDVKKPETKVIEEEATTVEEPVHSYTPVAGTIPAFEGHAATDAIEEPVNTDAPHVAEYDYSQGTNATQTVVTESTAAPEEEKAEEPVKKTIEESYK